MKEVIWFFGSSTAGKKTLIEKVLATPDSFRNKLGIETKIIKANKESLMWVSKKNHAERPGLVDILKEDFKNESDVAVLVKGQSSDLKNELLNKLATYTPEIKQKIIFVYTEPHEALERIKEHRTWYTPDMTEDYVFQEIRYQLKFLRKLEQQGVSIICVDSSGDAGYRIIDFPPISD